jgi:3-oxoacyl-[acyl-carrier protein] reductase
MISIDLNDKVAIVTGSGRGIGEAIAGVLAQAGAAVVIADVDLGIARKVSASLEAAGMKAMAVQVDVSNEESVGNMVKSVLDRFARIDILVNNAGVQSYVGFEDTTLEEWNRVVTINLTGMFLCSKAVYLAMKEVGGGAIVNLASMAARTGGQASPVSYTSSKTGVIGITKSTARSLGKYGIRVNAICPGIIDTEMIAHWTGEERAHWEAQMPLGRLGTPYDVGQVVLFLVSGLADYVTGTTTDINGGYAMY